MEYIITAEQLAKVTEALADAEGFMETMTDGPDDNEFLEHSRYEAVGTAKQLLLSIATRSKPLTPTAYVCEDCGSDDVLGDAHAQWSSTAQRWELVNSFPSTDDFCASCDGQTKGQEIPLWELPEE